MFQVKLCRYQRHNAGTEDEDREEERACFKQGETIKSDLLIEGIKIYTDAAWKTKKVPDSNGRLAHRHWHFLSNPSSFWRKQSIYPGFFSFAPFSSSS